MKVVKAFFLTLSLFVISEVTVAQIRSSHSIPELKKSLETSNGAEQVRILHRLAMMERFSDPKVAMENSEKSLELSIELKNDSLIAESYYRIGSVSTLQGNIPRAIDMLIDAQVSFNKNGYIRREMSTLNSLGAVYAKMGQFDKASEIYFKTLNYSKETNNSGYEVFTLTRIGVIQMNLGEYRSAKRFLSDAVKKAVDNDHWADGTMALTEYGNLETALGEKDSAIVYYQRAIDWLKEKKSNHAIPALLSSIGRLYKDENKLEESLKVTQEAIALADSLNNHLFVVDGLRELASIYSSMEEYELSIKTIETALQRMGASEATSSPRIQILNMLAQNYFLINNLEKAVEVAREASTLSITNGEWLLAESALSILIELEIKSEKFSDVISNQKQLMQVRDSIVNDERIKNILEFDTRYKVSQKEQEIALLEAENQQKSTIQLALGVGVVLILIIAFLIIRSQLLKIQRSKVELENEALKRKRLEQDLEFKNKQLVTQSLNIVQKKELMIEMKDKVETFREEGSTRELNRISNLIDYSFTLDKDWNEFRMHFEEVHSNFYGVLKENHGELTPNEMKLSALIKLNLSIKEMAAILGISPDSVKKARYRLRKKLELNTEDNLVEFMLDLEKKSLELS